MINFLARFLMISLIFSSCKNENFSFEDTEILDVVLDNTKNEIRTFNIMIDSFHPNEIELLLITEYIFNEFEFKKFNDRYNDLTLTISNHKSNTQNLVNSIDNFTQDLRNLLLKKDNYLLYERFQEILNKVGINNFTDSTNIKKVELGIAIIFLEYINVIKSSISINLIPFDKTKLIIPDTINKGENLRLFGGLSLSDFGNIFRITEVNNKKVDIICSYSRTTGLSTCLLDELNIGKNKVKGRYELKYVEKFPLYLELFDTNLIDDRFMTFETYIYVREKISPNKN